MPGHCAIYFDQQANRRLCCERLEAAETSRPSPVVRLGRPGTAAPQWLNCTCAPVFDYTGREVARVGLFGHAPDGVAAPRDGARTAWELARLISLRLGHLPAAAAAAL
jgi:hypothetical protein